MTVEFKKKKGSRKTKKGWRTLTDTTDVETFLEDKRLEERLGAPFKERKNEDLFIIDASPAASKSVKPPLKTKKARRQALLKKPVRCFQALSPDSAVPDPLKKRNRVLSKEERKHPLLVQREERRKLLGIKTAKELDREKNRLHDQTRRQNKLKKGEFKKDLWEDDEKRDPIIESDWLDPETKRHLKRHGKEWRKPVPQTLRKKSSVLQAVEPPHPGISYNPTYEDHQTLLRDVAKREEEIIKQEKHLSRVVGPMLNLMDRKECEKMKLEELAEGTPLDPATAVKDEPSDEEEWKIDGKTGLVKINPTTSRDKKKDLKKRRNIREESLKQALNRLKKAEKRKATDLSRLKDIEKEVELKKQEEEKAKEKREELIKQRAGRTKRLGKNKYSPLESEFVLPSQMQSSLRRLAPQGSILADRFNSLQKRNVVEVSARQKLTKPKKIKVFKKAEHKMPWEATNYKAPKRSAPRDKKDIWEF